MVMLAGSMRSSRVLSRQHAAAVVVDQDVAARVDTRGRGIGTAAAPGSSGERGGDARRWERTGAQRTHVGSGSGSSEADARIVAAAFRDAARHRRASALGTPASCRRSSRSSSSIGGIERADAHAVTALAPASQPPSAIAAAVARCRRAAQALGQLVRRRCAAMRRRRRACSQSSTARQPAAYRDCGPAASR